MSRALRPCLLALALLAVPATVRAASLAVSIVPAVEPAVRPLLPTRVILTPVIGTGPPQSAEIQAPGVARFEVAPGSAWRVAVEAPGFWAAPRVFTAGPEGAEQRLALLPAGAVEGRSRYRPGRRCRGS